MSIQMYEVMDKFDSQITYLAVQGAKMAMFEPNELLLRPEGFGKPENKLWFDLTGKRFEVIRKLWEVE